MEKRRSRREKKKTQNNKTQIATMTNKEPLQFVQVIIHNESQQQEQISNERKCYKSIHCSERMHTSCPISFSVVCDKLKIDSWKKKSNNKSNNNNRIGKTYTRTLTTNSIKWRKKSAAHKSWASRIFSTIWASSFAIYTMNSDTHTIAPFKK